MFLQKASHNTSLCFCQVAQIVKREMESAVKLYVKLKAKVKVGPSWGNLQDLDIWNITVYYNTLIMKSNTMHFLFSCNICRYCFNHYNDKWRNVTMHFLVCGWSPMSSKWTECILIFPVYCIKLCFVFFLKKKQTPVRIIFCLYKYIWSNKSKTVCIIKFDLEERGSSFDFEDILKSHILLDHWLSWHKNIHHYQPLTLLRFYNDEFIAQEVSIW